MSDTIYRQDAINVLEKLSACEEYGVEVGTDEETYIGKYEAITEISDLPSADRPQGWIPCSERLPKGQGYYICTCKDGSKYKRTTVVKWSNGWQLTGSRTYWVVVAWMPLPEPWKGADDGDQ